MISSKLKIKINKLKQKKYRNKYGQFLVEGTKGVAEALKKHKQVSTLIILSTQKNDFEEFVKQALMEKVEIEYCEKSDINKIKTTSTFPGIMAICNKKNYKLNDLINNKPIIALDGIKDPGNLGTIIRTGDWFNQINFLISENCVDLYNDKTVRSTMGSIFHTNNYISNNLESDLEKLQKKQYSIVTLQMKGKSLADLKKKDNSIYIFGSESQGIRKSFQKLGTAVTIPGSGQAESLNVAVSVGIVLNNI